MKEYLVRIQTKKGKNIFFETEYQSAEGLRKLLTTNIRLGNIANVTNLKGKVVKVKESNFNKLDIYERVSRDD